MSDSQTPKVAKSATIPTWAPRVPQGTIRQLYELDAQGIYDEYLLAEVGYGFRRKGNAPAEDRSTQPGAS